MEKEKRFVFYERWYEQLKRLPEHERLLVYESICEYAFNHIITDLAYYLECVMDNIRKTIDEGEKKQEKYAEQRKKAAKIRWEKRNNATACDRRRDDTSALTRNANDAITRTRTRTRTSNITSSSLCSEEDNAFIESAKAASTSTKDVDTADVAPLRAVRSVKEKELLAVYREVAEYFNQAMDGKQIQKIKTLNDTRKSHLAARLKDFTKQDLLEVIDKAAASDFLNGCGRTGFKATFDWIFRPNNFTKILEGNYDNGNNNPQQAQDGNSKFDDGRAQRREAFAKHVAKLLAQPNDEANDLPEALRDC